MTFVKKTLALAICLVLAIAFGTVAFAASKWDGSAVSTEWYGDGTAEKFEIKTAADFAGFAKLVNEGTSFKGKTVVLTDNIDLANKEWTSIGTPGNKFVGTFDGGEHTVSNLKIATDANYAGLFGNAGGMEGALSVIKNVKLENVNIDLTKSYLGGLVGQGGWLNLENCHITGNVTVKGSAYIGGILGHSTAVNINNCSVVAKENSENVIYSSYWPAGGIVGFGGEATKVTNCTAKNLQVKCDNYGAGGIAGYSQVNTEINGVYVFGCEIFSNYSFGSGSVVGMLSGSTTIDGNAIAVNYTALNNTVKYGTTVIDQAVGIDLDPGYDRFTIVGTDANDAVIENGRVVKGSFIYLGNDGNGNCNPAVLAANSEIVKDEATGLFTAKCNHSGEYTYTANEDGETHTKVNKCCKEVANAAENHSWENSACTDCGFVCENHSWENGTCAICGAVCAHGEYEVKFDSENHWESCKICGSTKENSTEAHSFANAVCEKDGCEAKVEIVEGKNQTIFQNEELTVKSNADFEDFKGVLVDGKEVDSKFYTAKEGSIVVTLKAEFVKTLAPGNHTVTVVGENGNSAETAFTVKALSTACNHNFDKDGLCKNCGIIVIDHTQKPENESNPNTGAPVANGTVVAIVLAAIAAATCFGKEK